MIATTVTISMGLSIVEFSLLRYLYNK